MAPEGTHAVNPTPSPVGAGHVCIVAPDRRASPTGRCLRLGRAPAGDISLRPARRPTAGSRGSSREPRPTPRRRWSIAGASTSVNDNGILQVLDAADRTEIYKARVGGVGNTFSASPWACRRKDLLPQRSRRHVRRPAPATRTSKLAKNSLDEMSFASPASRAGIFIRTQTRLYQSSLKTEDWRLKIDGLTTEDY